MYSTSNTSFKNSSKTGVRKQCVAKNARLDDLRVFDNTEDEFYNKKILQASNLIKILCYKRNNKNMFFNPFAIVCPNVLLALVR